MHSKISDVTILTIIISTLLLIVLGGVIIYFLYAYQRKGFKHQAELSSLEEGFNKTLLLSKLEIQEQTLNHIAKELHANISHLTSIININLGVYIQENPGERSDQIRETKSLVKQLMAEIKRISLTLNTEHIGKAGFLKMLEKELDRLVKTGRYLVKYSQNGVPFRLSGEKEIILFRLCQEILNNVVKHAKCSEIIVQVSYEHKYIYLYFEDDGLGFDLTSALENAANNNSTGLSNIYNRSRQISGEVIINSSPGKGSNVMVKIPQ